MKRFIILLFLSLLLIIAGIYLLIPSTLHVSENIKIRSSVAAAFRNLSDTNDWQRWWPIEQAYDQTSSKGFFTYEDNKFRISKLLYNDLLVTVYNPHMDSIQTSMLFIPLTVDTLTLNWSYDYEMSDNPIKRIIEYNEAVKTKKQFGHVLQSLQSFLGKTENIYGIPIIETSTKDTLLISTKAVINKYPSTADIYNLIDKLKFYIQSNNAKQTGEPMLNITPVENGDYKIMVALPVNKSCEPTKDIVYKRMIPGAFFATTVIGGDNAIGFANHQIQQYFSDYKRVPAAIPFQILVTNRKENTDTAKWITKLYFPVMN